MAIYALAVGIILMVFLSESPKYLVQRKKHRQAFLVIKKISKINGEKYLKTQTERDDDNVTIKNLLQRDDKDFNLEKSSIAEKFDQITKDTNQTNSESQSALKFVFSSQKNFIRTLLHTLVWFMATLAYIG
jgi:inorganic pyrophosphatase/exopolyphosphatase